MLARLTSQEFLEWQAYYSIEPWGEEREDVRHGIRAALLARSDRVEAFIPRYDRQPPTAEQVRVAWEVWAMGAAKG